MVCCRTRPAMSVGVLWHCGHWKMSGLFSCAQSIQSLVCLQPGQAGDVQKVFEVVVGMTVHSGQGVGVDWFCADILWE